MWTRPDFPQGSLPALEAAKCAALQGPEAFERMHLKLFEAFFTGGINIGRREEIVEVARQAGLDMECFLRDYQRGDQRDRILAEHREAVGRYGVRAIPTVIIGVSPPIVGAVPLREYERVVVRLLP
jgi:predicted DsbA family dithiol-disulfide isomerase